MFGTVERGAVDDEVVRLAGLVPAGVHVASCRPVDLVGVDPGGTGPGQDHLHPAERSLLPTGDDARRRQFVAGRACARAAMAHIGFTGPVLVRPDGSPDWPAGLRGSITHKDGLCIAGVGTDADIAGLGLDLEPAYALPGAVRDAVLTAGEQQRLGSGNGVQERLVFSAKEAYYKWFRSVGCDGGVGFLDVEVEADATTGELCFRSRDPVRWPAPEGGFVSGASWLVTLVWSRP